MTGANDTPILELRGISKAYGGVLAVNRVDLAASPGEVIALVGDNGAGKSTLAKIIAGAIVPDGGEIVIDGRQVRFASPRDAAASGVQMVYQDLALVDELDVTSNISLGQEQLRRGPLGWLGILDHRGSAELAAAELSKLGVQNLSSTAKLVALLSGGQRQAVAIARAVINIRRHGLDHAGVVLLDEPTAALGVRQSARVARVIRELADGGSLVVLISHDLPMCLSVSDRIIVMRRGEVAADLPTKTATLEDVVALMLGRHEVDEVLR